MDETQVERVMAAIDADRIVELVSDLIAIPSLSGEETAGQDVVAGMLGDAGLAVDVVDTGLDALTRSRWYSAEVDRDIVRTVIGTTSGASVATRSGASSGAADRAADAHGVTGSALLLNGHLDVVPTGDPGDWTTPPFTPSVRDGRVFGRGACDMKGGFAAALHALEALGVAGVRLGGAVTLASVVGEEDGGCGTLALLEHGVRADGCVIMEPTVCAVVPAVAGALSWRIRVRGLSAHGCLREEGVSALEVFPAVHRAVLDLEQRRNARDPDPLFSWLDRPFAICGGRISGGDWPSSEMDWLVWEGRYGVAPGEDLAAARAEFEDAIASAAADDAWLRDHPPTVEWWGGQFYPGRTAVDAPIVASVREAATTVTGSAPVVRGMPYGCDLGLTTNVGKIPTVVFGPGDVRDAHRPDESVPIADLVTVARTIALTAMHFCGVAPA